MDINSIIVEMRSDLNERIAEQVRELRTARGLSLDSLAAKSGISRSMISLIERGESSPTAVVLEKLAGGLDVTLASLFNFILSPLIFFLIGLPPRLCGWKPAREERPRPYAR